MLLVLFAWVSVIIVYVSIWHLAKTDGYIKAMHVIVDSEEDWSTEAFEVLESSSEAPAVVRKVYERSKR